MQVCIWEGPLEANQLYALKIQKTDNFAKFGEIKVKPISSIMIGHTLRWRLPAAEQTPWTSILIDHLYYEKGIGVLSEISLHKLLNSVVQITTFLRTKALHIFPISLSHKTKHLILRARTPYGQHHKFQ